jgi:hypothetical protein
LAYLLQRLVAAFLILPGLVLAQGQPAPTQPALEQKIPPLKEFSHKTHLALGNIAPVIAAAIDKGTYLSPPVDIRRFLNTTNPCEACHRGLGESQKVSRANMPRMADCLVCHNKVDPPDSCAFCHSQNAQLKPANHTADFLDSHTKKNAKFDKQSCAVCHGRKFTCLGCH